MSGIAGYITFDQVDSDIEVTLGDAYTDFEFLASNKLDTTSSDIARSEGVYLGGNQACDFVGSNGSNHQNLCYDDRIIKVKKYVSSSWVTVLEVAFIAPTATGFRVNVITANEDIPVLVKART